MTETAEEKDIADLGVPDEWLPAPETYRKIANKTASPRTNLAIAQRAHAGVLRAKAQVFILGRESNADSEIPREFWWAGGREALTQNWGTGDFETWIDPCAWRELSFRGFEESVPRCLQLRSSSVDIARIIVWKGRASSRRMVG